MEILRGFDGIKLEGHEIDLWAKLNTSSKEHLSEEDLQAIAMEHTADIDNGDESGEALRIPEAYFERAGKVLGRFICFHEGLSEWGGNSDNFSRHESELATAIQLQSLIQDGSFPRS